MELWKYGYDYYKAYTNDYNVGIKWPMNTCNAV